MAKYAVKDVNNVIANIIECDSLEIAEEVTGMSCVFIPDDVFTNIGLKHTDEDGFQTMEEFLAPVPVPDKPEGDGWVLVDNVWVKQIPVE